VESGGFQVNNRPLALLKNPFAFPKRKSMGYTKQARAYNGWMKTQNLWGFPCPQCKQITEFREDKNPEIFVCLKCGYEKRRKVNPSKRPTWHRERAKVVEARA